MDQRMKLGHAVAMTRATVAPSHQPFACVFAVDPETDRITHVSANSAEILGRPSTDMLDSTLREAFGSEVVHALRNATSQPDFGTGAVALEGLAPTGKALDWRAFASGDLHVLEVAPSLPSEFGSTTTLDVAHAAIKMLLQAASVAEVAEQLTRFLHRIAGYDHVIWWQPEPQDPAWATVLAEGKRRSRESAAQSPPIQFSDLWWSDRPELRLIADTHARPTPLLGVHPTHAIPDLRCAQSYATSIEHASDPTNTGVRAAVYLKIVRGAQAFGVLELRSARPMRPSAHFIDLTRILLPVLDLKLQCLPARS